MYHRFGLRELLTYLFAIFALNVRHALIIVDEPELHLHPQWQHILLRLFIRLAESTGNQFLLATHAPTFVSPSSIQFVSRVFSSDQKSQIQKLNAAALPDAKHLFNIVNSQNNERIFFADEVVLVEGILDRIFFEAVFDHLGRSASKPIVEVVSVGGKGFFSAYTKLLKACHIPHSIIADLDYVEQTGTAAIRGLFKLDAGEIKSDVLENVKSLDGAALVVRIDQAMNTGDWGDARDIWTYIKSRHQVLRDDLTSQEHEALHEFIISQRAANLYVLKRGPLESYLPEGYRSKELEKLIRFVASENFWDALPARAKSEIEEITRLILERSGA